MTRATSPTTAPGTTAAAPRRWDVVGLVGGLLLGAVDWSLLALLGVDMRVGGVDVALLVASFFTLTYAAFGFAVGRLAMARARARAAEAVIRRQLDELELSRRAAAQSEKLAALGRVAAGIAHEVRNPLGVIRASASLIREDLASGSESAKACRFIIEETDRLDRLIAGLLSFARPSAPRLAEVALDAVVERALELSGDETRRRGIEVRRELAPSLPRVIADPDLVAQVVFSLLVNAAEALERGGTVVVRAEHAGEVVAVEVADSGPGLSEGDAALAFEPFFTTKTGGTGLGLAVTARIIEAHGGRIEAVAGHGVGPGGRGACFRVELPLEPPAPGRAAREEAA